MNDLIVYMSIFYFIKIYQLDIRLMNNRSSISPYKATFSRAGSAEST